MALVITSECINCGACVDVCRNEAISQGRNHTEIDSNLCNECVGYKDEPQCVEVCPVDAVVYSWAMKKMHHHYQ